MKKLICFMGIVILLSSGCVRHVIQADKKLYKLEHLNKYTATFVQERDNVLLAVKKFSPSECQQLFGTNVIKRGYQPLQITVSNFSDDAIHISPTQISLPITSPKKVAKECHWKTGEIVKSAGVLACVFYWPALIPTIYCGLVMCEANVKISKNIVKQDMVQCWDTITVLPLENVSRIIFVSQHDFSDDFYLSIHSPKNKNMEFKVTLAFNEPSVEVVKPSTYGKRNANNKQQPVS